MFLQWFKDKFGNYVNVLSEVEYDGVVVWLVGEEGCGVLIIIEMVNFIWLDCVLGSVISMCIGLICVVYYVQYWKVFGVYLIDQLLMCNVLVDLVVEVEVVIIVVMWMVGVIDNVVCGNEIEVLLCCIGLVVVKYWVCKCFIVYVVEVLECLGGNGYVEDFGMFWFYWEVLLMGIWEGLGNVSVLDILCVMVIWFVCVEVLFDELVCSVGQDFRLDGYVERLCLQLGDFDMIGY